MAGFFFTIKTRYSMKTNLEIQNDIIKELRNEPFLNANEIGVTVKSGVVTLTGTVDSYLKKTTAENAAKRVSGVKAIAEEIEVKYEDSFLKNDTEIAEAVLHSLRWHSAVNEEKIKIKVEHGVVTLDGDVDMEFQRTLAIKQVESLLGVKKIINNIQVKTPLLLNATV